MKIWRYIILLALCNCFVTAAFSSTESGPAPIYRSIAQIELSMPLENYDGERIKIAITDEILRMVSSQYIDMAWDSLKIEEEMIKSYVVAIDAKRIKDSSFVEIWVDSIDPLLATQLANALAKTYISAKEYPDAIQPSIRQTAKPPINPLNSTWDK